MIDVSDALDGLTQPTILRTKTVTTVDFAEQVVVTDETYEMVVQVADMESLNVENIDYSLEYKMVHTSEVELEIDQFIVDGGKEYKIIKRNPYARYGYTEVVAEEVK